MTAVQVVGGRNVLSHDPASHPRKLICSTYGPLSAGHEALFWAALSVSFTSACNVSNGLIYCNSSGKQLL